RVVWYVRSCALREEDEVEQGRGISHALAQRPERAVAPVGRDDEPLAGEGRDGRLEPASAPSAESAPPDVGDRAQEARGDRAVSRAPDHDRRGWPAHAATKVAPAAS